MSANTCPSYSWCREDHNCRTSDPNLHISNNEREAGFGVIREEILVDYGIPKMCITENIGWEVPVVQVPALLQKMRAEIDRIEAAALVFMAETHPLVRRTEPGEPDQHGIGGGL